MTTPAIAYPTSVSFALGRSTNTTAKTLDVQVSTTSQTAGFTTVATYDHNNVASSSYNTYTVDLSAYSAEPIVYVRFLKTSTTIIKVGGLTKMFYTFRRIGTGRKK